MSYGVSKHIAKVLGQDTTTCGLEIQHSAIPFSWSKAENLKGVRGGGYRILDMQASKRWRTARQVAGNGR